MEEPQIHLLARGIVVGDQPEFMLKVFNNTVKGLRARPRCGATRGATRRSSGCSGR
jgi:hypothetical protein